MMTIHSVKLLSANPSVSHL